MNTPDIVTAPTIRRVPIGCRYPEDQIRLLDAIGKRRGDPDRAATIRYALDTLVEGHFPGSTGEAA